MIYGLRQVSMCHRLFKCWHISKYYLLHVSCLLTMLVFKLTHVFERAPKRKSATKHLKSPAITFNALENGESCQLKQH